MDALLMIQQGIYPALLIYHRGKDQKRNLSRYCVQRLFYHRGTISLLVYTSSFHLPAQA
jgi:hypothetical protein